MSERSHDETSGAGGAHGFRAWIGPFLVILAFAAAILIGLRFQDTAAPTVTLYAFSSFEDALEDEILPAFRRSWEEQSGEPVHFITSYAGSGTITDRIVREFPAEVAILSSEVDARRLLGSGVLNGPTWKQLPHEGVLARSPIVLMVRPGNPKQIRDLADLARDDVEVLRADPRTSGAGEWSILAVYGAALLRTGDAELAARERAAFDGRVTATAASMREAHRLFDGGTGDVLPGYAAEARAGELVVPPVSIVSETVVVEIARNVAPDKRALVDAFLEFLWSPEAQAALGRFGFEPVAGAAAAPAGAPDAIERRFTLSDLGGAERVRREILEPARRR